jgi:hypothetical protein
MKVKRILFCLFHFKAKKNKWNLSTLMQGAQVCREYYTKCIVCVVQYNIKKRKAGTY